MSDGPEATISVGGESRTREVCSLTLRTRGKSRNRISLTGGVDVKVDDEFAREVISEYFNESSDTDESGCTCGPNEACDVCGGHNNKQED